MLPHFFILTVNNLTNAVKRSKAWRQGVQVEVAECAICKLHAQKLKLSASYFQYDRQLTVDWFSMGWPMRRRAGLCVVEKYAYINFDKKTLRPGIG